ncbi:hypothetical protein GGP81_002765 [Salinibacter ruber]|nr:hypothetical protein [Salinibacter ruber]
MFPPFEDRLSGGIAVFVEVLQTLLLTPLQTLLTAALSLPNIKEKERREARPSRSGRSAELPDTRAIRCRFPLSQRNPSSPALHVLHNAVSSPLSGSFLAVEVVWQGVQCGRVGALSHNHGR